MTAQTIGPQKSNVADYRIHDETVCTHYNDNASTVGIKITALMNITTARQSIGLLKLCGLRKVYSVSTI